MGGLLRGIRRALAAPLGPIEGPCGGARQHERTGGHPAGVPLWGHIERHSGPSQNGEQAMNPVVRLGLTQPKVHAVHSVQGVGLLIDEDKKFVVQLFLGPAWACWSSDRRG
jgi:hypothetical protein